MFRDTLITLYEVIVIGKFMIIILNNKSPLNLSRRSPSLESLISTSASL